MIENKKLLLIDGHGIIYRAYYALQKTAMKTSTGIKTWAVYGFISIITKAIEEQNPDYIAISFDLSRPTVRLEQYSAYKAQREAAPDDLKAQIPYIVRFVEAMEISVFEYNGYEADDCIATLCKRGEKDGANVFILSGDTDLFQLVSQKTKVLYPDRMARQLQCYDIEAVRDRYGLDPEQLVDLKALQGDSSDNIMGVPGIGKVTATKLLQEFATLENIISNIDKVKSEKVRHILMENQNKAWESQKLVKLYSELNLNIDWERCILRQPDYDKLRVFLEELEFKTLMEKYCINISKRVEPDYKVIIVNSRELYNSLLQDLSNSSWLSIHCFSYSSRSILKSLLSIGLATENGLYYIPFPYEDLNTVRKEGFTQGLLFNEESYCLKPDYIMEGLKVYLEDKNILKYGFDLKNTYIQLAPYNIKLSGLTFDIQLAAFLLDSEKPNPSLEYITSRYLSIDIPSREELLGKGKNAKNFESISINELSLLSGRTTFLVKELTVILEDLLKKKELFNIFQNVEMPLINVLADMELNGINIDINILNKLSVKSEEELDKISEEIYKLAGEKFNINSPKQLGEILFSKLRLPGGPKKKGNYSTAVEKLEPLRKDYRIVDLVLDYRELKKLKTTYIDVLPDLVDPVTGKIHTSFNQMIASTGRLSSSNPNLQNIPVRTDAGKAIRKAFTSSSIHNVLLAGDYSQIELRILAHYSNSDKLMSAFRLKQDIHSQTARDIFELSQEDIPDHSMRRVAKTVNFGIIYGISDFGLSRNLGIDIKIARQYIESYFEKFPGVRAYIEQAILEARENGYVKTILGRRRNLLNIRDHNMSVRKAEERIAVNAPIQGSAADIIKLAMIKINRELESKGFKSKMICQVHDELIFDIPLEELNSIKEIIKYNMEEAYELIVPLVVELKKGYDWRDMDPIYNK